VSYWVGPDVTYIWVVKGTGEVDAARVDVSEAKLTGLVKRARSVRPSKAPAADRGASAESDGDWTPRLRGDGLLSLGTDALVASRALHALLVEPIRRLLPTAPGSLLTIVPHGPLFLLSFAALQDSTGRYLIERHAIHYAPAGVVLQLTEKQKHPSDSQSGYLLVGDPASLPLLADGKPLPRLPGTRQEVSQVAALIGRARATTLVGASATESEVRRLAGNPTVIHFATHGVVRGDDPLESFLALDTGATARSAAAVKQSQTALASDGRLTVREIYGLRLDADLVVLSACGTGLGKVSGDGVAGLARAFVYAGAPSVVATLWDLADEPAARFMPQFYRALQRHTDKAQALRDAQLKLLRDLRSGRVKVSTPTGTLTLREHPVLWAGYVLVGER
jgi:CHAT domain-containing protein